MIYLSKSILNYMMFGPGQASGFLPLKGPRFQVQALPNAGWAQAGPAHEHTLVCMRVVLFSFLFLFVSRKNRMGFCNCEMRSCSRPVWHAGPSTGAGLNHLKGH